MVNGNFEILDYYGIRERVARKGLLTALSPQLGPAPLKKFNTVWVNGAGKTLDQVIRAIVTRRPEPSYGQGLLF